MTISRTIYTSFSTVEGEIPQNIPDETEKTYFLLDHNKPFTQSLRPNRVWDDSFFPCFQIIVILKIFYKLLWHIFMLTSSCKNFTVLENDDL